MRASTVTSFSYALCSHVLSVRLPGGGMQLEGGSCLPSLSRGGAAVMAVLPSHSKTYHYGDTDVTFSDGRVAFVHCPTKECLPW